MIIIKRDGREAEFDIFKIANAVTQAMKCTNKYDENLPMAIANKVAEKCYEGIKVEEIQDLVEHFLMTSSRKDVAVEFIRYREQRSQIRRQHSRFMGVVKTKLDASDVQNQNANVDQKSFGGRKGEAANELVRQFVLDNVLSEKAKFNHQNNRIYIHDLCDYTGQHNCLTLPIDDLLKNGFKTRQTDIRPAGSLSSAFQLLAVTMQCQSLCMFGGVAVSHLDWTMVPYVRKSFYKHYRVGLEFVERMSQADIDKLMSLFVDASEISIDDVEAYEYKHAYEYALAMTKKELVQSVQSLYHNLNSLQSRAGSQLPFSSINYGTCTLIEGQW